MQFPDKLSLCSRGELYAATPAQPYVATTHTLANDEVPDDAVLAFGSYNYNNYIERFTVPPEGLKLRRVNPRHGHTRYVVLVETDNEAAADLAAAHAAMVVGGHAWADLAIAAIQHSAIEVWRGRIPRYGVYGLRDSGAVLMGTYAAQLAGDDERLRAQLGQDVDPAFCSPT